MVGGRIYFRGPHKGYSKADAKLIPIGDGDWDWLAGNLNTYLSAIGRMELYPQFANREQWQVLHARGPHEKYSKPRRSIEAFHKDVWDSELGRGGLIGDLVDFDRSQVPANHHRLSPALCPGMGKQEVCCALRGELPDRNTRSTNVGGLSVKGEWMRRLTLLWLTRPFRHRSAAICAPICACRAAPGTRSE